MEKSHAAVSALNMRNRSASECPKSGTQTTFVGDQPNRELCLAVQTIVRRRRCRRPVFSAPDGRSERPSFPGRSDESPGASRESSVHPADGVILAVGIIVTSLRPTEFVSAQQHRNSTRNKECQEKILDQAISQGLHIGGIARAFNAAIVAVI